MALHLSNRFGLARRMVRRVRLAVEQPLIVAQHHLFTPDPFPLLDRKLAAAEHAAPYHDVTQRARHAGVVFDDCLQELATRLGLSVDAVRALHE